MSLIICGPESIIHEFGMNSQMIYLRHLNHVKGEIYLNVPMNKLWVFQELPVGFLASQSPLP